MYQEHLREHLSEGTPVQPPREPAGGVPLPRGSGESGQGEPPFHGGGRDSSQPGKNQQQTRGGPSRQKNSAWSCVVPPRRGGAT